MKNVFLAVSFTSFLKVIFNRGKSEVVKENSDINFIFKYRFSLLLAAVAVGALQLFFGFYYEDTHAVHPAVIYGCIASPPYSVWFNEALLFQIPVLAFLSECFSDLPVVGIWQFTIILLHISLWLHLALRVFSRQFHYHTALIVLLSIAWVAAVVFFSLGYVHFSRNSMLLVSASLLLYADYYLVEGRKRWLFVFLFFLGLITRVSTGFFAFFILSLLLLLHVRDIKKAFALLKVHWITAIFCLAIVWLNRTTTDNAGVVIEQYYEYALSDRGTIKPISAMNSKQDSIRYEAFTNYFLISDTAQISLDFIASTIDDSRFFKTWFEKDNVEHLSSSLSPIIIQYRWILALLYVMLLIVLWSSSRKSVTNAILFHIICWIIVASITIIISMYEYFLLPMLTVVFNGSFFLVAGKQLNFNKWQKAGFCLSIGILVALNFLHLSNISRYEKEYNRKASGYLGKIDALSKTTTPIIWDYYFVSFPSDIFSRKELNVFKKCLYMSNFAVLFFDFGQEPCLKKFGFSPLDWKKMQVVLKDNHHEVKIVTDDRTADFFERYFQTLYHADFTLVKDTPSMEITPGYFVFHILPDNP